MAPVRFGCGLGMERFERFRFSVPAVPLGGGLCVFQYSFTERTVPVSVPGKRFRRFRFRVRFPRKRFRRFRFPVPVRFLGHPEINLEAILVAISLESAISNRCDLTSLRFRV